MIEQAFVSAWQKMVLLKSTNACFLLKTDEKRTGKRCKGVIKRTEGKNIDQK